MPSFTLNININQNDLTTLYRNGYNVVVAKPSNGGGSPNVAWVVFRPFMANTMTWEEQYGIYASMTQIQNGATIVQMSATPFPAVEGQVYTLSPGGFFGPPQGGGAPGSYAAINQFNSMSSGGSGALTFGLYQSALVNGRPMNGNAVFALPVFYQSMARMIPSSTIYIWVQPQVGSNTVITNAPYPQTRVDFGGGVTQATLAYNAATGGFQRVG
jgi:hypothetical protein